MNPTAVIFFVAIFGLAAFISAMDDHGYTFTREPLRPEAPKPRQRRRAPRVKDPIYTDATLLKPRGTRRKPSR